MHAVDCIRQELLTKVYNQQEMAL